jgi:hypothetical protein
VLGVDGKQAKTSESSLAVRELARKHAAWRHGRGCRPERSYGHVEGSGLAGDSGRERPDLDMPKVSACWRRGRVGVAPFVAAGGRRRPRTWASKSLAEKRLPR